MSKSKFSLAFQDLVTRCVSYFLYKVILEHHKLFPIGDIYLAGQYVSLSVIYISTLYLIVFVCMKIICFDVHQRMWICLNVSVTIIHSNFLLFNTQ